MSDQPVENPEFDHLLHWVNDVPAAVAAYCGAGLPAHENVAVSGFLNGGWRLDERYVEILTVTDDDALRSSRYAEAWLFSARRSTLSAVPEARSPSP